MKRRKMQPGLRPFHESQSLMDMDIFTRLFFYLFMRYDFNLENELFEESGMKKFLIIAGLLLIAGGTAVAWAMDSDHLAGSWRYKVTVEIETPEGLKTGSAVRQVDVYLQYNVVGAKSTILKVKGEAVAVDLGKRGVLFAVMGTDDYYTVFQKFPIPGQPPGAGGTLPEGIKYYSQLKEGKAVLEPEQYPRLVRFRDMNDPKTVELVLETGGCERMNAIGHCASGEFKVLADRFEEFFGEGVKLRNITIEMTGEPVTWDIDKYLSWLANLKGGYLDGGFTSRNAPYGLYGGNFKSGEEK